MGQVYAYDRVVEVMISNPTGRFFGFIANCLVGSRKSKTIGALKAAVKAVTFMVSSNITGLTCK